MKEASIEVIKNIRRHPNADKLELANVLGYQVVIQIDKFNEGQKIVYIKSDSVLPKDQEWAAAFLQYAPNRVKAIKLRGEWSEGLVINLNHFSDHINANFDKLEEGFDVTESLPAIIMNHPFPRIYKQKAHYHSTFLKLMKRDGKIYKITKSLLVKNAMLHLR